MAGTNQRAPKSSTGRDNPVSVAFRPIRSAFWGVAVVSFVINILMLTGPVFMLQVYDRVLASGSVPTLVVIGALAIVLYIFYGILEGVRGRILSRLGQRVDARLSGIVYKVSNSLPVRLGRQAARLRPVQDLDTIRQFLSGPGPAAIFDIPWLPLYLGIVFLFHPLLGLVGLAGAVIISVLIGLNEFMSRRPTEEAAGHAGRRSAAVESGQRNSEVVAAMGMQNTLTAKWDAQNSEYLATQRRAADTTGIFGTTIKTIRFILQSAILAVGAWLAIQQEITPGVMIAASIMTSRALAPIEQAVAQWRGFVASRQALRRLREILQVSETEETKMDLPQPEKGITVEQVYCGPFGETMPYVQNVTLDLQAGDGLGVIGPSGSGKSTFARALVGVTLPLKGVIRFDGAELAQWDNEKRGEFIGYLPQDLQLFDGTVAENIARFREDAEPEKIIEAAKLADVHDMIVALPEGYNTMIGRSGRSLSAGQRQRLALARALYNNPFLVVLDEPNSNLDAIGESALTNAIKAMREKGSIVVVIAHRPSAIATVDKILCLKDGKMAGFGPKEEVLRQVVQPVQPVRQGVGAAQ
ncbi:MAG: type I secretion system permease/ATPase [Roseibium album]|uniref:Type I secretion system ATP-binding protein PrsD n=1 Tax=Roseibium album TaxID=311410 RepID=A0A0M7AYN2_9HYPH|nr:type I secretion system permease/ATPase [Roseibium album]MBG6143568.1 ATP-binding cassette subfamily C protein [Labrenzia sp. EL_142]MBG6156339.1 ATP-binding cassette subfamily C protein [Labrenzia sp. EL_162]MBG6164123.1 ATP-binding cassette subfamily C protein [Labrenzia sp. EL_195]MBG6176704.1 ATP-binding cassette subfamily C protein [Labrenzia sp. EL_132]MBG6194870.1 ATP-binding cassette subfamily C protein [Labrenzia sp. EL_159]MBG6200201.1 ATP-binding cassette subfamily C protein [La